MYSNSILFDTRWIGPHGLGRFAREIMDRLPDAQPLPKGLAPFPFHRLDLLWVSSMLLYLRPKVYFSPGFNPPLWSPVPFIFTIPDLILLRFPEEASRAMQPYWQYVVKPAAQRAHRIITISEFSKQEVLEWTGLPAEKVVNVGCGVDPAFSPEGSGYQPGYPYLFYVGNRKPHKNIPRLLRAFATADISQKIRLMLSGKPDETTTDLANHLGLTDRVVYAGLIPDEALPSYYRGALALVFPSLYEGFGLPPLEAMACGTPVVSSNVTSLPEVVGNAAILVNPLDVEAIAHGIEKIVHSSSLRALLCEAGILQAKKFTWEKTVNLTRVILEEV